MLSATEFYSVTPGLEIVLWIEAVIYLGIGVFELFDDFVEKPQPWMTINGRVNGYVRLTHRIGHKMHAGICVLLGFVALNGILEGAVTRFELELIFLSFAILMPAIWSSLMPGRLGIITLFTKPEFWLQLTMFIMFTDLIRPQILVICVLLNLWGIFVYFRFTRKKLFQPFTYPALREHCVEAIGEEGVKKFDKLVGYPEADKIDTQS
jgi:hypothetical protein